MGPGAVELFLPVLPFSSAVPGALGAVLDGLREGTEMSNLSKSLRQDWLRYGTLMTLFVESGSFCPVEFF